jgi:polysaccharide export outer membrane protein
MRRLFTLIALSSLACACAHGPAVQVTRLPSAVISRKPDTLDPALLEERLGERDGEAYRVGPGDTLLVAVYNHPELSIAPFAGASVGGARPTGLVIDNDGTIQFPLVGSVKVAGKSAAELCVFLEHELAVFVKDPKVNVQVVFAGSIRYYLLGQFTDPGVKYSDRPLRLLEALSLGGSVTLEHASLRGAYVARAGKRLPVNFRRLVREGDLSHNIRLRSGDVVFVPDNSSEQAYVFAGPASNGARRGGAVPFVNGELSLMQALSQVGFGYAEQFQGRLSETIVLRSEGDRGELLVVNARDIMHGQAAPFALEPGDVVFVPPKGFTNWNQALAQILPTLQTISGLLTPFVQIKYLQQ